MLSIRRPLLLILLIALSISANLARDKQSGSTEEIAKVEKTYDSANDRTTLSFSQWPIAELQDEKILMDVEGWYPGRTPRQPANDIKLKITSVSSTGYKYEKPINVIMTAGGHRFQPWQMTESGRSVVNGEYVQTMEGTVDFNDFFTVAQTDNVKMELNQTQMLLRVPRLKKLAEFGRLLIFGRS